MQAKRLLDPLLETGHGRCPLHCNLLAWQHVSASKCGTRFGRQQYGVCLLLAQVLLDVGAGMGFHSLAAAARGHRVISVELSPTSLASLNASIAFNGFHKQITMHQVAILACEIPAAGKRQTDACPAHCVARLCLVLQPAGIVGQGFTALPKLQVSCMHQCLAPLQCLADSPTPAGVRLTAHLHAQVALGAEDEAVCIPAAADADLLALHGYSHPDRHNVSMSGQVCRPGPASRRVRGAGLVPANTEVGAVRIGAPGWEGWVLQGLQVRGSHNLIPD